MMTSSEHVHARNRHRPVKTFILDQTKVAGFGNLPSDETLFGRASAHMRHSDTVMTQKGRKRPRLRPSHRRVTQEGLECTTAR